MIISRSNADIKDVLNDNFILKKDEIIYINDKNIILKFLTVHRSKGLEADNIIVLNVIDELTGFPNKIEDDRILRFVSNKSELYDEERRLFYVALTRTKNRVYLLTQKNKESILAFNILGVKSNKAEEFIKAGINVKTIRLNNNNTITESMSFRTFKFKEIVYQKWEDSDLQNYFSETRFLFVVYKQDENGVLRLKGCQFWNMPYNDLEVEMKQVWEKTKQVISDGSSFRKIHNKNTSDLPKLRDNKVGHVRPHARNSNDVDELPNGKSFPKQCFWLNNYYIVSQLNNSFKD